MMQSVHLEGIPRIRDAEPEQTCHRRAGTNAIMTSSATNDGCEMTVIIAK